MNALLEAENEALKATIKFLELKLSLLEENPKEPKEEEFIEIGSLRVPELHMLAVKLELCFSKNWVKSQIESIFKGEGGEYVAGFSGLSQKRKMKAMVKAVKELQSEGKLEGIKIHKKSL